MKARVEMLPLKKNKAGANVETLQRLADPPGIANRCWLSLERLPLLLLFPRALSSLEEARQRLSLKGLLTRQKPIKRRGAHQPRPAPLQERRAQGKNNNRTNN